MTLTCGATHPTYKKLFCCRVGACVKLPHTAPIRRGQWVTWSVGGPARQPRKAGTPSAADAGLPRKLPTPLLETGHYGRIGSKSRGRCWYCGIWFLSVKRTLGHVVPRSKGGSNDLSNLVFACQPCNSEKRNMSLESYRLHVQTTRQQERVVFYGETVERSSGHM